MNHLWAITCFFNPTGCPYRLQNYRIFRRHLTVPLIAIEMAFEQPFELQSMDAEKLVQLRGGAVLWQKERLLNVALQHLPDDCDFVAWLDSDVIFARPDWPETTVRQLEKFVILQPFDSLDELSPEASADGAGPAGGPTELTSVLALVATGRGRGSEVCQRIGMRSELGFTNGMAWAARRELLNNHGLYDARILGGGDRTMVSAMVGGTAQFERIADFNQRQSEHFHAWAEPFAAATGRPVGICRRHARSPVARRSEITRPAASLEEFSAVRIRSGRGYRNRRKRCMAVVVG